MGKTLSAFPLAPAYAKVIAMANQHDLMPYAILLIAALSVREPLVPVSSIRGETEEETKEKMTATLKLRRSWCGKGPGRRLGDLLVLMRAVTHCDSEKMSPLVCAQLGMRHKAMVEIRRLRTQLTNIVNTSFKPSVDLTMDTSLPPPSDAQAQMLRQMMVAGLADRIARRVDRSAGTEEIPKGAYQTIKLEEFVFIDPCSVLYTEEPDYVIYQEIVQLNDRKCMQCVMMVDHEWLTKLAESYCNFSSMDKDTEPRYDKERDEIVRSVEVTFGPLEWRLTPVERPIPNDIMLYRYFGQFLLAGEVVPLLAQFVPKMLAPPTTMVRSWARLQKRTENLLNALAHTKEKLVEEWHKDENYLLEEYLDWLPDSLHGTVTVMWPPLESESCAVPVNCPKITRLKYDASESEMNIWLEAASTLTFTFDRILQLSPTAFWSTVVYEPDVVRTYEVDEYRLIYGFNSSVRVMASRLYYSTLAVFLRLAVFNGTVAITNLESEAHRLISKFYDAKGPTKVATARLVDEWLSTAVALCQEATTVADILCEGSLLEQKNDSVSGRLLRLRSQVYKTSIGLYRSVLVRMSDDKKACMIQSTLECQRFIFLLNENENLSELFRGSQPVFREYVERAIANACESETRRTVEELEKFGLLKGIGDVRTMNSATQQAIDEVSQIFPHLSTQYVQMVKKLREALERIKLRAYDGKQEDLIGVHGERLAPMPTSKTRVLTFFAD
ncbi:unnamed protein product [Heligmosomoides polygyrus]|uniref:Helicase-associated domain-containing protein n=1 Tax=Heligmosomoides polygyrus TaxID=6339 RepID=A0A3P7Y9F5_HELPZ|nr:unnamed protein product [Heligmosomoides polygyrus]